MTTHAATIDERHVRSLLDRLDPAPTDPCGVAGCEHRAREARTGASRRTPTGGGRARPGARRAAR